MPPRLDVVGLVMQDMAASLAFYRRLRLEPPDGAEIEPHVEATLPGGLRLAWDTVETIRSFDPTWAASTGSPRIGLAFLVDSAAEVDELYAQLVGAGYEGHKEPWNAFWGQRYAVVEDTDGNHVDLLAPL